MGGLPLEGVRVLEMTHIVAGPTAGLLLGDMGADVVKIESPDPLRDESRLLAEIISQLIERTTPIQVERRFGLGGTMICFASLQKGEIDLYVEYTGTALLTIAKQELGPDLDPQRILDRLRRTFQDEFQMTWLAPLGFNNSYGIAVRPDLQLTRISQLRGMENGLVARFHHEFLNRPDGFPGLVRHYGLEFGDVGGIDHGLAYLALRQGQIDVTDAYTTDGVLRKHQLVILEDDRQFFPPYQAAPLVRLQALQSFPELESVLGRLAGRLGQQRMIDLNHAVAVEARSPQGVAQSFLVDEGLIPASDQERPNSSRFRASNLVQMIIRHLYLTLVATLLATIVGVAGGMLIARYPGSLAGPVLALAGILQTIPSLAMLAIMLAVMNRIGPVPAIAALFLYALLPIIRSTYAGIRSVPAELRETGLAMGMTDRQLQWWLELPLASRNIMAGIRTALVISIGTATLGTFIGAGGLGDPIKSGLELNDRDLILWGAIPAALLALACDFLMSRLERLVVPRPLRDQADSP